VIAAGHSVGGKGAVWATILDPRIKACVAIDPVDDDQSPIGQDPVKHPSVTPELMGGFSVPALFLAGQDSGSCAPAASNACRFDEAATSSNPHYLAVMKDFGHMQFVDASFCLACAACSSGVSGAAETLAKDGERGLIVAFLQEQVRGDAAWHTFLAGAGRDALVAQGVILDDATEASFCASGAPDGGS
jgi:pimeloyl-ACP methyl ester carboxylesterase